LPLLPQLLNLLEIRGYGKKVRSYSPENNVDGLCDISDGLKYKELLNGILVKDKNSLSLTFNTDGVPLFKSSAIFHLASCVIH